MKTVVLSDVHLNVTTYGQPQLLEFTKFLKGLLREELKQDANWIVKLRKVPETPETFYLLDLMASNDFQK